MSELQMHVASATSAPTTAAAAPAFHTNVANAIRDIGTGLAEGSNQIGVAADKGAIYPFEAVASLTGMLKDATAKVPFVSKGTSLVHTIGGFAVMIAASQVSGTLKAPGSVARDMLFGLANAIDGSKQSGGFSSAFLPTVTDANGDVTIAPSGMLEAMKAAANAS
jgi:hypothetical protein